VRTTGRIGVEMEALTVVAAAALTLIDMLKAVDRTLVVEEIALWEKRGGRSGEWIRPPGAGSARSAPRAGRARRAAAARGKRTAGRVPARRGRS
jgi:cyclic pyranopterin phosphate synthase